MPPQGGGVTRVFSFCHARSGSDAAIHHYILYLFLDCVAYAPNDRENRMKTHKTKSRDVLPSCDTLSL